MAIINNSKNFIFVHVPKAAGTSITNILANYTTYRDLEIGGTQFGESIQSAYKKKFKLSKHSPSSNIRNVVGTTRWNNAYTFSFVRNPYNRVVSTYKFLLNWQGTPDKYKNKLAEFEDINEYVLSDIWEESDGPDSIFRPQTFWLTDQNDRNKVIVDFVGKVESLDNDLHTILENIDPDFNGELYVPTLNSSSGEHQLNRDAINKVNEKYSRDFSFWKYEKR